MSGGKKQKLHLEYPCLWIYKVIGANYDEMKRNNYLVRAEKGVQSLMLHPMGAVTFNDATHPDAQTFVWSKCKESYYDFGIGHFWLDEAEPEFEPYDFENVRYHLGNGRQDWSL